MIVRGLRLWVVPKPTGGAVSQINFRSYQPNETDTFDEFTSHINQDLKVNPLPGKKKWPI